MKAKNILIIYENTGGGHLNIARILEKMLTSSNTCITLIAAAKLVNNKTTFDPFVYAWNYLIRRNCLRTADVLLNFFSRIFLLPFSYSLFARSIFNELDKLAPDIIIATADCNRSFGSYCAAHKIPFFIFINEPTIFVDTLSSHATHLVYFQEAADIIHSFKTTSYFSTDITPKTPLISCLNDLVRQLLCYTIGYPFTPYFKRYSPNLPKRNNLAVEVLAPFRGPEFYQTYNPIEVKQRYNIPAEGYNIIVSNGSLGGIATKKILHAFEHHMSRKYPINLLIICGSDKALYAELSTIQSNFHETCRVIPIAQQPTLADLYHIADCSIGRGTAGILVDSLVSKTPSIVLSYITANDLGTLDIIKKYNIGEISKSYAEIPVLLEKVLTHRNQYLQAIENLFSQYSPTDYEELRNKIKSILKLNSETYEMRT